MKRYSLILFATLFAFLACKKDFVVEDISKKKITVNAPANNLQTDLNTITFWWDELDGAEEYNLQIVKPEFTNVAGLLLDTNISITKFNFTFSPGTYQWRIKATNAGHSTAFQTYSLKIDTTSDLSNQLVNLTLPSDGAITGNTVVTFNWQNISSAKKYRFVLNNGALKDTTLIGSSITCTLPAVKNATTAFTWNVKAINDQSESQFKPSPFTLIVDLKPPTTPGILAPANSATVQSTDSLKWSRSNEAVYDSIYVSDDSTFSNLSQFRADNPYVLISDLNLSPSTPGNYYYWRIKSFDLYHNGSSYSARRKIKLN